MATKKEIEEQVNVALIEIGEIQPWFDKKFNAWKRIYQIDPLGISKKV